MSRAVKQPKFCVCGCGERTTKKFARGHDQTAVRNRITERWGDTEAFMAWFDATRDAPTPQSYREEGEGT